MEFVRKFTKILYAVQINYKSIRKGAFLMEMIDFVKIWYPCPICGQKLLLYDEKYGKSEKLYVKCKKCKKEIEIIIE